jgi:uncharacterized protein (DUF2164 family)
MTVLLSRIGADNNLNKQEKKMKMLCNIKQILKQEHNIKLSNESRPAQ